MSTRPILSPEVAELFALWRAACALRDRLDQHALSVEPEGRRVVSLLRLARQQRKIAALLAGQLRLARGPAWDRMPSEASAKS